MISADDQKALGFLQTSVSTPYLNGRGELQADIRIENSLRFWLGVANTDVTTNGSAEITADIAAGPSGVAAKLQLIPPCETGLSGPPPFLGCSQPGVATWTVSFCSYGSIKLTAEETVETAALDLLDFIIPGSPITTVTQTANDLLQIPKFNAAAACLVANSPVPRRLTCMWHAVQALTRDKTQISEVRQVFLKTGFDFTVDKIVELLFKAGLDGFQQTGDRIAFLIDTTKAGQPGKLIVSVNAR
jgi:hypothetical protein